MAFGIRVNDAARTEGQDRAVLFEVEREAARGSKVLDAIEATIPFGRI